jgi:hypothetical protein
MDVLIIRRRKMNNALLIVFTAFAIIDLTFVGTTTYFVVKLVKKILKEKDILEKITEILDNFKKSNRNFIEKGI